MDKTDFDIFFLLEISTIYLFNINIENYKGINNILLLLI